MYCQLASESRPSPLTWSLFTPIDSNLCSHARAVILYVGDLREKRGRPGLKPAIFMQYLRDQYHPNTFIRQ